MGPPYGCVVIPGIGGSQLSFTGGSGGKTALWWNPTAILKYTPLAMGLANDGASPWPIVGKKLFPDGPVNFGIYEPLLTQLANDGLNPTFWAYDWRLGLNVLANQLAIFLAGAQLTNPFFVVAHSMGGLIARLAYPLWQLTNAGAQWGNTVYLGSPHGGSYWAPAMLSGLYGDGAFFKVLGQLLGLAGQVPGSPLLPIAIAGATAGQLLGSWPSMYALIPSAQGTWAAIDPQAAALNQLATYANTPGGQQQQWFTQGIAIQKSLSTPQTEAAPAKRFNVCGQAPSTLHSFVMGGNPGNLDAYKTVSDGDATVPTDRASWEGVPTIRFKNCTHNQLCTTLGPLSRLTAWLKNPPTADETLPNNAAVFSNPGGSTIDFVPIPVQTFYVTTGDP